MFFIALNSVLWLHLNDLFLVIVFISLEVYYSEEAVLLIYKTCCLRLYGAKIIRHHVLAYPKKVCCFY